MNNNNITLAIKKLAYHSYQIVPNGKFPTPSLVETLDNALRQRVYPVAFPDVSSSVRDVIATIGDLNDAIRDMDKGEINLNSGEDKALFAASFEINSIIKGMLVSQLAFSTIGIESSILVQYTWLVSMAWQGVLSLDTEDICEYVISGVKWSISLGEVSFNTKLFDCIPSKSP